MAWKGEAVSPLVPIRFAEWWALIWLFFDRVFATKLRDWSWVAVGTMWSFLLDLPVIAGVVVFVASIC